MSSVRSSLQQTTELQAPDIGRSDRRLKPSAILRTGIGRSRRRRCSWNYRRRSRNSVRSRSPRYDRRRSPRGSRRITRAVIHGRRRHRRRRWPRRHRLHGHRVLLRSTYSFRHFVLRKRHRLLQGHLHRRTGIEVEIPRTGEQSDRGDCSCCSTDGRANDCIFAFATRDRHARSQTSKLRWVTSGWHARGQSRL